MLPTVFIAIFVSTNACPYRLLQPLAAALVPTLWPFPKPGGRTPHPAGHHVPITDIRDPTTDIRNTNMAGRRTCMVRAELGFQRQNRKSKPEKGQRAPAPPESSPSLVSELR